MVDDVTAWCLLALVVALTAAVAGVLFFVFRPLLTRLVARKSDSALRRLAPLALVEVLLCAMATEWIGVHAMFGAFLFSLVFPRGNAVETWLHENTAGSPPH